MEKVTFSRHAINRFKERFPEIVAEYEGNTPRALAKMYYNSSIDNSIKNNTKFMLFVHEKHGYDSITFSLKDNAIFVCKGETLVTVMDSHGDLYKHFVGDTSTFRKKR